MNTLTFDLEAEVRNRLLSVTEIEDPIEPVKEEDFVIGFVTLMHTKIAFAAAQEIERRHQELNAGFLQIYEEVFFNSKNVEKDLKNLHEKFQNHLYILSGIKRHLYLSCHLETRFRFHPPFEIRRGWYIVCKDEKPNHPYIPPGTLSTKLT